MAGVHPWDTERGLTLPDFSTADMVGETGLDFARNIDRKAQEELFRNHLAVAEQLQKPVVVHSVKAFEEVMRILDDYDLSGVLLHGFIGSKEQAERAFKRGYLALVRYAHHARSRLLAKRLSSSSFWRATMIQNVISRRYIERLPK